MENSHNFAILGYLLVFSVIFSVSVDTTKGPPTEISELIQNATDTNDTAQDLYIIKTVVYEVGILTDAGNDTEDQSTHETVEVSIFDPNHNGTIIDLSNIPLPIQTNVSGISVTGLLKKNLGTLAISADKEDIPILPDKQVTVKHNISTSDPESEVKLISQLSKVLGLPSGNRDGGEKEDNEANLA